MIDLHAHSTYSFKDGYGTADQVTDRMLELNRKVVCLTEHDNVYSAPLLQQQANQKGLDFLLGCEIRTVPNIKEKRRKKNHLTLIAKSPEGYSNICKMITLANIKMEDGGGFYYKPAIDTGILSQYKEDVMVLSGCMSGYLSQLILENRLTEAMTYCKSMKELLGDSFYLEVMPHDFEPTQTLAPAVRALHKKFDIPLVLTNDTHLLKDGQTEIWKILHAMNFGKVVDNIHDLLETCYYMEDEVMWKHANRVLSSYFTKTEMLEMFNNQEKIVADCVSAEVRSVGSVDSGLEDPYEELKRRTYQGLIDRNIDTQQYRETVEKELDLIFRKGFADYFIVVSDMVQFAKSKSIMTGPSRGCFLPENRIFSWREGYNWRKYRNFEEIKVGDHVLTSQGNYKRVVRKFEYEIVDEECVEIILEDNEFEKAREAFGVGKKITCTGDHKIRVKDGWATADSIVAGDELECPFSSGWARVKTICVDCGMEKENNLKRLLEFRNYRETGEYRCFKCANHKMSQSDQKLELMRRNAQLSKTPEMRERISKSVSKVMQNGLKFTISESMKKRWQDKEYVRRWQNGIKNSFQKGQFYSEKMCKNIGYDSSYELEALRILENDETVEEFDRCELWIDCFYHDGWHKHNPDFLVKFCDGEQIIINVKPESFLDSSEEKSKFVATCEYAFNNGYDGHCVWTEKEIFNDIKHYSVKSKEVNKFKYTGKVYDIEVEEDNTYNVEGVGVHNSVGGSLVSYCVNITEIDPVRHGLVMERFMSEDRVDPPDIDVDFQSSRRFEVIAYLQEKYGDKNVAHMSTLQKFKGRNTLKDVGKAYGIPIFEIEKVQGVLVERGRADARASATIEDTFNDFPQAEDVADRYPGIKMATVMEGQVRHSGVNAAGFLVTRECLENSCSLYTKVDDDSGMKRWVASVDMWGSEELKTLKLDVLALSELDILDTFSKNLNIPHDQMYELPLDDSEVLQIFEDDTLGVFQFGATGTASVARQLAPITSFDHVTMANSLSRPGPLHSGQTEMITQAKLNGEAKIWDVGSEDANEVMRKITSSTFGYMVFQEQIMKTMREISMMDWATVAKVRNAMSKSYGDEYFDQFREIFANGAKELYGISHERASEIFDHASHFGSYAFNLSHSVGYSVISFVSAMVKTYYPREFYRTLCDFNEEERLKPLLREYIRKDLGKILPPKIGKSSRGWQIEGNDLRAGLKDVLPPAALEEVLSLYPIDGPDDLLKRAERRKVNKRTWEKIEEAGLFDENEDMDPFGLYLFAERMSKISDRTHKIGELGYSFGFRNVIIAGTMDRQINEKSLVELQATVKLKDWRQRFDVDAGDLWCLLYLVDETGGPINIQVKNTLYPQIRDYLWTKKANQDILVVEGLIPPNKQYIIAKRIWDGDEGKYLDAKCFKCSLAEEECVEPIGPKKASIMLVGMAPGKNEVEQGRPFVGRSGKILDEALESAGIVRDEIRITNTCLCRAHDNGANRNPTQDEIDCCYDRLIKEVEDIQPEVIVPLGQLAYSSLVQDDSSISQVQGEKTMWGDFVVVPAYHPAACLYDQKSTKKESLTKALKYARQLSEKDRSGSDE